ncbi:MAG TPA: hypothetical protein VEZ17_13285 [Chitinophagaceae bacterium]|nr:hypothetical protein [Chitinophagaceae bacterium]
METRKIAGLITSGGSTMPYALEFTGKSEGLFLKKVHMTKALSGSLPELNYPGAEIVNNIQSIIQDDTIELVIVSTPASGDLSVVARVLEAGKHVRII